jgi:hypothetical protein
MKATLHNVTLMNQSIRTYICLCHISDIFQSLAWVVWLWCFSVFYTVDIEANIEIIMARPLEFYEFFLLNVIYFYIKKQD